MFCFNFVFVLSCASAWVVRASFISMSSALSLIIRISGSFVLGICSTDVDNSCFILFGNDSIASFIDAISFKNSAVSAFNISTHVPSGFLLVNILLKTLFDAINFVNSLLPSNAFFELFSPANSTCSSAPPFLFLVYFLFLLYFIFLDFFFFSFLLFLYVFIYLY